MTLCMIMLVFVYMFIFWIYLLHMRQNIWALSFWAWLTSLNMMSSNCIHLPSNHILLFLCLSKTPFYIYIYHNFLIHLSVVGHLGCFHAIGFWRRSWPVVIQNEMPLKATAAIVQQTLKSLRTRSLDIVQ
jgi:hypothetical protein